MKLNHKEFGSGPPLLILHGVFGSLDNWVTVGKQLAENFKVILVDARNHGSSPHSDIFDFHSMAEDVRELLDEKSLSEASILGHSMGGKTAMTMSGMYPERIKKLIVVDIAPKYYPPHHEKIFQTFDAVRLDTLTSRSEAEEQMKSVMDDWGVRQFLLKNLYRSKDGSFRWKLNLETIRKSIENIGDEMDIKVTYDGPTLFIRGDKSDYIVDEDKARINALFPEGKIISLKDAGHWVHADQPAALIQTVISFLLR